VLNFNKFLQDISKMQKKRFLQLSIFVLTLILISCVQNREKDRDELVLAEYVIEKNGIYYNGDYEIHAKKRFTGECKFYHNNGRLKGFVQIKNGLPTGQWKYWDSTGKNILDMYFEKGRMIKKGKPELENEYPWTKNMTKNAINAILKSIENIKNDSLYQGNFPTDTNNMPFVRKEKTEFVIVGFETSINAPENYKIDFHPRDEYDSGPRITVEMNMITEQAIKVYMTPDA
jgi:hypothetical protein